jgi:hypothetical protein
LCFVNVLCVSFKINEHGGHWGNVAWTLTQWRHIVALHEATNVLYWSMHIALYCPGGMAIKIVVNLTAFFVVVNFVVAHNCS